MAIVRISRFSRTIHLIIIVVLSLHSWAYPVAGVVIYDADFDGEQVGPLSTQSNTNPLPLKLPTNTIRDSDCRVDIVSSAGNLSNKPVLLDSVPGGLASAAFYNPSELTSGQWQISWDSLVLHTPVDGRQEQGNVHIVAERQGHLPGVWRLKYNPDGHFLIGDAHGFHSIGSFTVGISDHFDLHLDLDSKTYIIEINGSSALSGHLIEPGEFRHVYFRSNGRGLSEDLAPFAFDNLRVISEAGTSLPSYVKYSGGTGEPNDPYQIATAENLMLLGKTPEDYDKHFILTANIHLGLYTGTDFNIIGGSDIPFTGLFDGNGHTISNFSYTSTQTARIGLFGFIDDPNAQIINLGLINPNIHAGTGDSVGSLIGCLKAGRVVRCYVEDGSVSGDFSVGGLVGKTGGTIINSYSTSNISGNGTIGGLIGRNSGTIDGCCSTGNVSGEDQVGGLVGNNTSTITNCFSTSSVLGKNYVGGLNGTNSGTIDGCYSTGNVSGEDQVGGLVGQNGYTFYDSGWNARVYYDGTISKCYSTSSISGYEFVGGLVGLNDVGIITNCYATSSAIADHSVGGLVGYNWDRISNCYSLGIVLGINDVGGLVGFNQVGGSITFSFWDIEMSGFSTSAGGTGKTTAEMQTATTFLEAGWDLVDETVNGLNDVWTIIEGKTYPLLSWQKYGGGTGEPNDPYLIYTAEHLNALGAEPNDYDKYFKLMVDVNLSGYLYERAVIAPDINDVNDGFQGTAFNGVFDGKGHTISHLTIVGDSYLGLFGQTGSGASICNLVMEAVDVNGTGDYVGGLVGSLDAGTITYCYVEDSNVSGGWKIGGLVGGNSGQLSNCYVTVNVLGDSSVGGLVGENKEFAENILIENCHATGSVKGHHYVGGLVGENHWSTIRDCCATGNVTDTSTSHAVVRDAGTGGLVGTNDGGTIRRCYSVGSVAGHRNIGGLVGINHGSYGIEGTIINCYSTGYVTGINSVGGLVGYNHQNGSITACFWDMETSGQASSAGGNGKTTTEMQTASTFLEAGWDFVNETKNGTEDIWWIDEGNDYPRLWWEIGDESSP